MWAHRRRLQFLPQPALSQVPRQSGTGVDGGTQSRAIGGALLPRCVHAAAEDRCHRLPEQGRHLRPPVQGERRDAADDRRGSQAPRCEDRLHLGAAHMGQCDDTSPACANDRAGWRDSARRIELDQQLRRLSAARSRAVAAVRGKMLALLKAAHAEGRLQFFGRSAELSDKAAFNPFLQPLYHTRWHVYAKRPFEGPQQALAYLARYTHRVAISNNRLVSADEAGITFRYKDYRIKGPSRSKTMTLAPGEFIRRFMLHVLPKGFHRIRHYGLLASCRTKAEILAHARELIAAA